MTTDELKSKTMKVILSCETMDQLKNSVNYYNLAFTQMVKGLSLNERASILCILERSVGFAQAQIKYKGDGQG